MSAWGFDSSSFGEFARTALSTATKQIDKVLDIDDNQDPVRSTSGSSFSSPQTTAQPPRAATNDGAGSSSTAGGSFWDSWDVKVGSGDGSKSADCSSSSLAAIGTSASPPKAQSSSSSSRASRTRTAGRPGAGKEGTPLLTSSDLVARATADSTDNKSKSAGKIDSANGPDTGVSSSGGQVTSKPDISSRKVPPIKKGRTRRSSKDGANVSSPAKPDISTGSQVSTPRVTCDVVDGKAAGGAQRETAAATPPAEQNNSASSVEDNASASTAVKATVSSVGAVSPVTSTAVPSSDRQLEQATLEPAADASRTSPVLSSRAQPASDVCKSRSKPMVLGSGSKAKLAGKSKTSLAKVHIPVTSDVGAASERAEQSAMLSPTALSQFRASTSQDDFSMPLQASTPVAAGSLLKSSATADPTTAAATTSIIAAAADSQLQVLCASDAEACGSFVAEPPSAARQNSSRDPSGSSTGSSVATEPSKEPGIGASSTPAAEFSGWEEDQDIALPDPDMEDAASGDPLAVPSPPSDRQDGGVGDQQPPSLSPGTDEQRANRPPHDSSGSANSSDILAEVTADNALVDVATDNADSAALPSQPQQLTNTAALVPAPAEAVPAESVAVGSDDVNTDEVIGDSATTTTDEATDDLLADVVTADDATKDDVIDTATYVQASQTAESNDVIADDVTKDDVAVQRLRAELAECRKVLDVRERKMVELSRDNIDLQEGTSILRNQLQQAEEVQRSASADVDDVTAEFTERLSTMERRFQMKCKDYDKLRKDRDVDSGRSHDSRAHYEKMLQEKDESIEGLMAEGEKLSKQQLQHSNTIKKLRAKEKELDQQTSMLRREAAESVKALEKLQSDLKQKDERERKYQESLLKVNTVAEKQSKELAALKTSLEAEEEKARGLQAALDNAYKEIASLQKDKASTESAAHEAALESEIEARRQLKQELDRTKLEARQQQESLLLQISDLRASMTRAEQVGARREDHLKQEVEDLRKHLQVSEGHSQDLTNSVSGATRPLLRQIENLQSSHSAQVNAWEKLERNLSERLSDAQSQLAEVTEHDRLMSERVLEQQARLSSLESSSSGNRQDKARLMAELELLRARHDASEEERATATAKLDALRKSCQQDTDLVRKEKFALQQQLETEKTTAGVERKRAMMAEERLDKERQRHQKILVDLRESHVTATAAAPLVSPSSRLAMQTFTYPNQGDILEESMHGTAASSLPSLRRPTVPQSPDGALDNAFRNLPVAVGMETLQSLLKQREGEAAALHSQVALLDKARASLSEELVSLAADNEQLKEKLEHVPALKRQVDELDKRYNTMLQMYGEKAEESNELRMDLEDVKSMYKQQIQDMLLKSMH